MDDHEREQNRERYEMDYKEQRKNGDIDACRDTAKAALEQFPRDYHAMMNLAETLQLYSLGSAKQREEYAKEKYAAQIRSLCERVLEDCRKEQERGRATLLLCRYYAEAGNNAEALQMANNIADLEHCRDVLLGEILTGEEKKRHLQKAMLKAVDYVASTLVHIACDKDYEILDSLSVDERIEYVKTANQLYELLMPDGNYQFFHRIVGWNNRRLAELYLLKQDSEKAYEQLLAAEKHAEMYDTLTDNHYTALFVRMLTYLPSEYYKCWQGSERGMLLYRMKELEKYFCGHNGFLAMKARLEQATQNEKEVRLE